jgi:ubiquinone/menaquinone biosynthesis C-methylase UbiE
LAEHDIHIQDKIAEIGVSKKGFSSINPEDYDSQNRAKELRLKKLNLIPLTGKLILDAGCGPGTYGVLLAKEGNEVVGVDLSLEALKLGKKRSKSIGSNCLFQPILADLENLPLINGCFDICFIGWALHHFPSLKVVGSFAKVIKKNGNFALTEPNEIHPALRLSRQAEIIIKGVFGETGQFTENVSVHTYHDYCECLRAYGLSVTMLSSCYAAEPVVVPRNMPTLKKGIFRIILISRHIFCVITTGIHSSLNGTDLLIVACKKN